MPKKFCVTGICIPEKNYMVDISKLNLVLKEIIFLIQRNQEKPILQGLQRLWEVVRCAGISMECNTYATSMQQIYQ